jgi:hypothetical protein
MVSMLNGAKKVMYHLGRVGVTSTVRLARYRACADKRLAALGTTVGLTYPR